MIFRFLSFRLLVLFLIISLNSFSQEKTTFMKLEALTGYTTPGYIPFWLRSNQNGSIPTDKASLSLIGTAGKEFESDQKRLFDWGAGLEIRSNIGASSNIKLIEGYIKLKAGIFQLKAGRSKEISGFCDTLLTSGSFSFSGNSLGIPQVQISVPEFYTLPVWDGILAFKGNFVHGWLGETEQYQYLFNKDIFLETYFHQKSLYGRFGKPAWKIKLYGGFNHQVFWGREDLLYEDYFTLNKMVSFLYVITGKPYGTDYIGTSKIGNHLGSIDMGIEYNFGGVKLLAYRQNIYDIGALYYLANIRDGLNGLNLINQKKQNEKGINWNKILIEFLYTKNQAGELWSPYTPSGDEDYYNNDQFVDGYSYKGMGMGNPLLSRETSVRSELPRNPRDKFINNRVIAFHLGFDGSVNKWHFLLKASYSYNYGTYGTSEIGHSLGSERTPPQYGIFPMVRQFSGFLKTSRKLNSGVSLGLLAAMDTGKLLYNSAGVFISGSKSF